MSHPLRNLHIKMGEPCGDGVDFDEIAEWAAELIEQQAAELERLNADRQLQAKLLLAAHKMLMSADLGPSSKDYLDQWAFIRDAELERLRADLAEAHATIASKILGFDAEVGDVFDAARVEMLHICAAIAVGQTPQKPAARTTAADLLARVRGNCTIQIVGSGNPTTAIVTGPPDLLRELAEALRVRPTQSQSK